MRPYLGEVANNVTTTCVKMAHDVEEEGVRVEVERLTVP
jgi:hypothetical protein